MPKAGGSYNYLREAYGAGRAGSWFSFLMVWQIMFSAPLSVASGSIGFANYLHYRLPQACRQAACGLSRQFSPYCWSCCFTGASAPSETSP